MSPSAVSAAAAGTVSSVCTTEYISFTINVYGVGNGLLQDDIWYQLTELGGSNEVILDDYVANDVLTELQIVIPLTNASVYSAGDTVNVNIQAVEVVSGGTDPFINGNYSCVVQTVTTPPPPTPSPTPTPVQCASDEYCVDLGLQCSSLRGTPLASPNYCQTSSNGIGDCCLPQSVPTPPVITPPPPPSGPIPAEYIPCVSGDSGIDEPEYHTRRPYQASPCNPKLEELDLYCANDLITKETFIVSPADADSCVLDATGQTCFYSFDSVLEVSVDLTDAELPIVGNTQLVPNQVNGGQPQPEQFSYTRRVNEYLTWWLDGAPWKGDEELMDPDEIDITYPQKHLITYGGPIKKLFPKTSQIQSRSDRIGQTRLNYSHNQIFECTLDGDQVPCRYNAATGFYEIVDTRGTDDPADDIPYRTRVLRVLDNINPDVTEYPWMPFTSTEDRLGSIYAILDDGAMLGRQPTLGEGNDVVITSYDFVPSVDTDLLYFAHMEEAVSLVDLLQRTYTPLSISRGVNRDSEPASYYNTYRCDLKDVRWNSGDDLFGEVGARDGLTPVTSSTGSEATGESITGLVNYSGQFQCHFDTQYASQPDCVQDCSQPTNAWCDPANNNLLAPNPNYLYEDCASYCQNEVCSVPTCTVDALTATSLYTETPKAEELWDRTVVGDASLLRRMFPALGRFGEILKDYPAVTSASYEAQKSPGGTTYTAPSIVSTYAGDPTEEDPGSNAELYIPHLGGIKVLTMDLMQDMLRPESMNSKYFSGGIPPGSDPNNCGLGDGICSPENLATYFSDGSIAKGIIASIICERESGGYAQALNYSCTYSHDGENNDNDHASCVDGTDNSSNSQCTPRIIAGREYYFDGATLDYSAGLFQHNLLVVCPGLSSGQGTLWDWDNPPWCVPNSPGYPYCLEAPWCEFNTSTFDQCRDMYFDPVFNIQEMVRRSSDGTSWGPWCTGNPTADCGIPGC